jgi:F-type H+-transporting ATPase subunit b
MLMTSLLAEGGLLDFDVMSAIWVLIIFSILVTILYKTAWKNVLAGLKAREDRIRGDIAHAEQVRRDAEAKLKEYADQLATAEEKVREIIAKATGDAHKIAESINAAAQVEAEGRKEKAVAEIEQAKRDALRQVYDQTAELATSIASKILRRNLNAADQQALVKEALGQLQNIA